MLNLLSKFDACCSKSKNLKEINSLKRIKEDIKNSINNFDDSTYEDVFWNDFVRKLVSYFAYPVLSTERDADATK